MDQVLTYPEYFKFFANWITPQYQLTKEFPDGLGKPSRLHGGTLHHPGTRLLVRLPANLYHPETERNTASLVGKQAPDVLWPYRTGSNHPSTKSQAPYILVFMYNRPATTASRKPLLVRFYRSGKTKAGGLRHRPGYRGCRMERLYRPQRHGLGQRFRPHQPRAISTASTAGHHARTVRPEPDRKIIGKNLKVHQIEAVIQRDKQVGKNTGIALFHDKCYGKHRKFSKGNRSFPFT